MDKNEKLREIFMSETFKKDAEAVTTAEELQKLFEQYGLVLTIEEVVDLCGRIAQQKILDENGEITESALDDVTGGIAWALIGLGVVCIGSLAIGIYNGYRETKRKDK